MYIHQEAVVRWRAFGDAMNRGQMTRTRLLLWIPGVFLLRLLRKLIDQSSIACCGFAFRQLCMQRPSHNLK